ncbi:MAG: PQQ-binding-like beta-propeller repeat protein [Candidatus Coatesbacteria bacterium]|nr:PQQ-binding-like beta-propeller repeat protein [Candidatus Coatesbacteria bacterium]
MLYRSWFVIALLIVLGTVLAVTANDIQLEELYPPDHSQLVGSEYYEEPYFDGGYYDESDIPQAAAETVLGPDELDLDIAVFETDLGFEGWRAVVPGGRPLATPAVGDGLVYVGGGFGSYEFYAFAADDGAAAWMFKSGDDGPTAAVYDQGRVAFNTESCILYVLDADSGEMVWGEWLGDPLMAQPAIAGNRIVMTYPGQDGHHITARELETGQMLWDVPIIGEVLSAPIIADGSVYFTCLEGTVYRLGLDDGATLFEQSMAATSAPWISGGEIYLSQREEGETEDEYGLLAYEGLAKLDTDTGERANEELWQRRQADYLRHSYNIDQDYYTEQAVADASVGFASAPGTAKLEQAAGNVGLSSVSGVWAYQGSRPVVRDGRSWASQGDAVICTDIDSGEVLFEYVYEPAGERLGGRMLTPPSFAGDKLVIGTEDGYVLCLDAEDGELLWSVEIGEPIRFQPALWDGWVYVGTDRGTLYGFDTGDDELTGWAMWGGDAAHNG